MLPLKFEGHNVIMGEGQPDYEPLPAFKDNDGVITTLWEFTPEEREAIANGENLMIQVSTFNKPLQPVGLQIVKEVTWK